MTGGLARDHGLERLVAALDDAGRPSPPTGRDHRRRLNSGPRKISVTVVDRLKADPFAFYAQAILNLRPLDPVDADHSAAWKGTAVHDVLEHGLPRTIAIRKLAVRAPSAARPRRIHPMLRALVAAAPDGGDPLGRGAGDRQSRRRTAAAGGRESRARPSIGGVTASRQGGPHRPAGRRRPGDRRLQDRQGAGAEGGRRRFRASARPARADRRGGRIRGCRGRTRAPRILVADQISRPVRQACPDKDMGAEEFLAHARAHFLDAAAKWLTGERAVHRQA